MASPTPLNIDEARQILLDRLSAVSGWESVALRGALDRILYRDVIAPIDVPAHANSAMDGYALRRADLAPQAPTRLAVVGVALAGKPFAGGVGAGQAVRIMTGAALPAGADCVVAQEAVHAAGDALDVPPGQAAGQNIRLAGEDLARGTPALRAGKRLGPVEIGVLASLGIGEIAVYRRLRVALFSTGDEIAPLNRPLQRGEIYDSNRYTIHATLTRLGVEPIDLGVVRDDPAAIERALNEAALTADVILTSGGVSLGDADYVREISARLGAVEFWRLNVKPGRPLAFGRIGAAWLFGLPGNPVAAMVALHQIVIDALSRLMGCDPLPPHPLFKVVCVDAIAKAAARREYARGLLFADAGQWRVRLAGAQGSGILSSLSNANCYIVLPENGGDVAVGDLVDVEPFAADR